ncbi:MAG: phosphodiester glycosidase family protein [Parachlamydiales bacterium]|jgi:uncharacterized protein YigE (DUF2233 family)
MKKLSLLFALLVGIILLMGLKPINKIQWMTLDDGLYYAEYDSPVKSITGDSKINILKINPATYKLNLFTEKENGWVRRTAPQWAGYKNQVAIINAGMFMGDRRSCGYMKNFGEINNSHVSENNCVLAFNPMGKDIPTVQIIDRQCQEWNALRYRYQCFDQSIRMVDCNQVNVWKDVDKMWSVVTIAMDKDGNVLFIFCRSPYRMHDFIDILLNAPIDLYNMMYLEGGPLASFYLNCNGKQVKGIGSYESDFYESNGNNHFWTIPNVIGIERIVK